MEGVLLRAIEARLDRDDALTEVQKRLVLAACEGTVALERALDLEPSDRASADGERPPPAPPGPAGAYLRSIAVSGFRGVGPAATLELEPGPGLTLVIGRNGSGKSSFAEAVEVLFTGQNERWKDRAAVWKEGWRNLRHEGPVTVEAELVVEGDARRVIARRTWSEDASIDGGVAEVHRSGGAPAPLASLGWTLPLQSYRPFLSYNELGSMLDDGPSRLFDAMSLILGLEEIVVAERGLAAERKAREAARKHLKERVGPLLDQLAALDDDRARSCWTALSGRSWDLDAVAQELLAPGDRRHDERRIHLLQQLAAVEAPATIEGVEALVRELRGAAAEVAAVAGSDSAIARQDAALLESALAFHARHAAADCPVCGTPSVLGDGWAERCRLRVRELRERAKEADDAHHRESEVRTRAWRVLGPAPRCLDQAREVAIDARTAIERWTRWSAPDDREDVTAIAAHLEATFADLFDVVDEVRHAAAAQLERRELAWRPVARSLDSWLADARADVVGSARARDLKVAERWLKAAAADVRDERFRPVAEEARRIWAELRTRSSVDLLRVALEGSGTRRRVELDVSVDGVDGAALGVMSQGELHALALSLFLPRATSSESPFRFVVIDDPVQSMDPSRVDGLARVLDEVARRRQVVVFTHDDRLPSAVRDLEIDARVVEVTRRAGSVVELRQARDPVARQLDDARALVATDNLPATVARRLIPGFCRGALEAACVESVRRRWLRAGRAHDELEAALARATTLTRIAALCLFDDDMRGGDVLPAVNRRFTRTGGDVYQSCNRGSHDGHAGDLRELVDGAAALAQRLRSVP